MSVTLGPWLVVDIIGTLAFPIGYASYYHLPNRGYAFIRGAGPVDAEVTGQLCLS